MHLSSEESIKKFFEINWDRYKKSVFEFESHLETVSYNLVSMSTYSGHLENYHSDIWRFLLDKKGAHGKGNLFLKIFIDFLVGNGVIDEEFSESLKESQVLREKGRIDVLLLNPEKKVCLIIENKINNAIDQDRQLERYRDYVNSQQLKLAGILYVTLFGNKLSTIEEDNTKIVPISVFSNDKESMYDGWLIPSKENIGPEKHIANENIKSFLNQYCNLILHLSQSEISNMSTELLYKYLENKENFQTAILIEAELEKIKYLREKKFSKVIENHFQKQDYFKPAFSKKSFYSGYQNHMIFDGFNYDGLKFQLDIIHYKDRTCFVFYNTGNKCKTNDTVILLSKILNSHSFEVQNSGMPHQITYTIKFDEFFETLSAFDQAVAKYAIEIFDAFNRFKENK